MGVLMWATVVLAGVNVLLALGLGVVYYRNHREIRSPFTLGLLLFATFLAVHNAVVVYDFFTMMSTFAPLGETFAMVETLLQTLAVGALLVATLR